jgi:hypothetical protein
VQTVRYLGANSLLVGLGLPAAVAFRAACRNVARAQERILLAVVRRNAAAEFGRRHGFAEIRSVAAYRERVPLSSHEDYASAVARVARGERRVLTVEPALRVEPTSGSSAAAKLIPYTRALRADFQRAILPWLVALYLDEPALLAGPAYWSVSPVTRHEAPAPGDIPVGFEEDTAYLGWLRGALARGTLAVPPEVRLVHDVEAFRYATLLWLLRQPALALVSVWNPAFLSLLVARLFEWGPRLADDIARGAFSPPAPLPPDLHRRLAARLTPDPRRAAAVRHAIRAATPAEAHARLWPRLRLVSCWADGAAALDAPAVARLFPQARLQGKGLLATEGVVSIPLVGQPAPVLAVRSHFFEFLPAEGGPPRLAHELEPGRQYSVVLTTGGGFYRYRLGDVVEVQGHLHDCPLLRFVGREGAVADRFGEKLHEAHVQRALGVVLARHRVAPQFAMLACEGHGVPAAYTLYLEAPQASDEALGRLGPDLDAALAENFHYRYCRDLGQLAPVAVFRVEADGAEAYLARQHARGQRLGDVKPTALARDGGWSGVFRGRPLTPVDPALRDKATPPAPAVVSS